MKHLNAAHKALGLESFEEREFGSVTPFIMVYGNSLSIKIQHGPIGENGINGVQVTDLLSFCNEVYKSLNKEFPCTENALTIHKIEEALLWQEVRTKDREKR